MPIIKSYKFLILFGLCPLLVFGQNESYISDSIKVRELAQDLNRKATILYQNGLYTQALDTFLYSLDLRKSIYGNEDYNLGPVYNGLGITYGELGQFDLALKYLILAEKNYLLRNNFRKEIIANVYINTGNVYRKKLDYNKALQYFEQALSIKINEKASAQDIAGINYNIAEIYYLTNNYNKAIGIINENLQKAYIEDQVLYYELLAFINHVQDNFTEAKFSYENAIRITLEIEEKNHINIAVVYLNYSLFLITINDFQYALTILEKAYSIIQIYQPNYGEALANYYLYMGELMRNQPVESTNIETFKKEKTKNLNDAFGFYEKSLASLKFPKNYTTDSIQEIEGVLSLTESIRLISRMADTYFELAEMEINKQSIQLPESLIRAIEKYETAGSLIQRARKELHSDESKIQLSSLENSTFYSTIKTAHLAYTISHDEKYIDLAFQNAERIKSSSIFEKISDQIAVENSLIPDSLLQIEKKLNSTISIYSGKLFEENSKANPDSIAIANFSNLIFNATRERENLNRYMENEFEDYYELKYSNSMLRVKEIQNKLNDDQVILEYVLNETDNLNELYTFIISTKKIDFIKNNVPKNFVSSIESMFNFISNKDYLFTVNDDSKQFCISSYQLYSSLILPFKNEIKGKNLIIVPDGKLSYIPFEGLIQSIPDTLEQIKFNKLEYLILDYNINYSNSANLFFKSNSLLKRKKIKTLAFAPEYSGEKIEIAGKWLTLVPLPGVRKEVDLISNIVNTKVYFGKEASETNFRDNVEKFDILHLAMHAFINDSLPAFSSLAFAQTQKNKDSNFEGLVSTADIYNLKLNAKLTVLSACNTGIGKLRKGEGIMSIARGFLYAGCPSIVMSLWEVDDLSGTEIISSFYKNLKKGKRKDEALRQAKLEYLKSANSRTAHPHYWLSFIAIGDNSSMYNSRDLYFFILLSLVVSGIGLDQILRIRKARKNGLKN